VTPTERWLALTLAAGPAGPKAARLALEKFGSPDAVLAAGATRLEQEAGLKPEAAKRLAAADSPAFHIESRLIAEHAVQLVPWDDAGYPTRLKDVPSAPLLLYVKGRLPLDGLQLAVVGTRNPSRYGDQMTRSLIAGLARLEPRLTVVSGLARGIDGIAHAAALDAGLQTVAVLGNGLSRIYPPEHEALAARIQNQGALLSEFPMTMAPLPPNFPVRNRIIAGLAHAVLLIEAGEQSGSLITAGLAQAYGRPLLALPSNADQKEGLGTNRLLQSRQAQVVLEPRDILAALTGRPPPPLAKGPVRPARKRSPAAKSSRKGARTVTPAANSAEDASLAEGPTGRILGALRTGPQHPDELAQTAGLSIEQILGLLLELELSGEIVQTSEHTFALP
jgi:DNA processing protein